MRKLKAPFARPLANPRSRLWLPAIAATTMVLALSINVDRPLHGSSIASAQAAAQQCAAQPLISTRCPQASCIKAGPCYLGVFISPALA
jgi:hypothetical protein